MKKRIQKKVTLRGVGKPKREWEPAPVVEGRPLRKLGRKDVFGRLTDKGKGMLMNLITDPKKARKVFAGKHDTGQLRLVPGTGAASRISRPELSRRIAAIRATLDVKQYEELR